MKQCYMRFPEGKKKAFTISYDDNITQEERLIHKMEEYNIKGTFNSGRRDLYQCNSGKGIVNLR